MDNGLDLPDPAHIATVDIQYDDDYQPITIDVVSFDVGATGEYDAIHNDHSTVYRIVWSLVDRWPDVVANAVRDHAASVAGNEVTA